MGKKEQWFEDSQQAFAKLYADVGSNNVKVYDVKDYSSRVQLSVQPKQLLEKCTQIEVAVSGEAPTGRDWMVIAPYRLDVNSGKKFYDVDPILTVLDADSGIPSTSGVVAFHQDFGGRTTEVDGHETDDFASTVSELRNELVTGIAPLESGSPTLLNGLAHMYKKFKDEIGTGQ